MNNEKDYTDQGLQDFLTNDMKEKSRKFNEEISGIICQNCQNTLEFSFEGQIVTKCRFCPIDNTKQMTSILSNKISMWIRQKTAKYYSNKNVCECGKVWPMSLITKCCRLQMEKKSTIPFEIHTFVYLAKELIEVTISKLEQTTNNGKGDEGQGDSIVTAIERLETINERVLGRFLERSDFENITGVFDMFRI